MDPSRTDTTGIETDELVCFVIGPIGDKHSEPGTDDRGRYELAVQTLEKVIEPACLEAGIGDPLRADKISTAGEITEQTFRLIRDADIVIADVTDGNPNVMYELGLRHTKNKLTLQIGERGKLPFDINVIRTIQFKRTEGGYIDAKNDLRRALETGLSGRFDPVTATRLWLEAGLPGAGQGAPELVKGKGRPAESAEIYLVPDDEAPGYLELISDSEETFPRVVKTLEEIADVTGEFGKIAERGVSEIKDSDQHGGGTKGRLLAAIRFAERLDEPSQRLEALASSYRADVFSLDAAMNLMLDLVEQGRYEPEERADIVSGLQTVVGLGKAVENALPGIQGFRSSIDEIAPLARPIRVRARTLTSILDGIIQTSETFLAWANRSGPLLEKVETLTEEDQDGSHDQDQA